MPRGIRLALFLTVVILLTIGVHAYLWLRLVRDPSWPAWLTRTGVALVVTLGVLLLAGMPLIRYLPRAWGTPVGWVTYSWMGAMFLLVLALLVLDGVQLALRPWVHPLQHPERRLFLKQLFAVGALGITGLLGGTAVARAAGGPTIKRIRLGLARWPQTLNGLTIVQLTDLHIGPLLGREWLSEIVQKVNQLSPDLIVITGDLVDSNVASLREHVAVLAGLVAPHGVFFVTGNHEYYAGVEEWVEELTRLGIKVLRNEHQHIDIPNRGSFVLAGVDDHHHGSDLKRALAGVDQSACVVLLAHQPAAIEEASALGVDLQLSGHTHAGQIWPWNYLVRLQQPYVAGLHRHKSTKTWIYVSPGTGYWGPPMRLGSRCEITQISLYSASVPGGLLSLDANLGLL